MLTDAPHPMLPLRPCNVQLVGNVILTPADGDRQVLARVGGASERHVSPAAFQPYFTQRVEDGWCRPKTVAPPTRALSSSLPGSSPWLRGSRQKRVSASGGST